MADKKKVLQQKYDQAKITTVEQKYIKENKHEHGMP